MTKLARILPLVFGLGLAPSAWADDVCGLDSSLKMSGGADAPWTVQLKLAPENVPMNAPFGALVAVCSDSGLSPARVTVDATMPAHKHGMNYDPKTSKVGEHSYQVENLLFHMPGTWRLEVTVYENDKPHRYFHNVDLR